MIIHTILTLAMTHDSDTDCWICMDHCDIPSPCKCKNHVHPSCLAEWQLRNAGKKEERRCRFCKTKMPDWKYVIRPNYDEYKKQTFPLTLSIDKQAYTMAVSEDTTEEVFVNCATALYGKSNFCPYATFHCKHPNNHTNLTFCGDNIFEAAIFCIRVQLAEHPSTMRQQQRQQQQQQQQLQQETNSVIPRVFRRIYSSIQQIPQRISRSISI